MIRLSRAEQGPKLKLKTQMRAIFFVLESKLNLSVKIFRIPKYNRRILEFQYNIKAASSDGRDLAPSTANRWLQKDRER